jgi:SAM-dependent methyltransferase
MIHDSHDHGKGSGGHPNDASFWDERYGSDEKLWSGNPNGALVMEVADLVPGRALDVGCGEGADAIWLAKNGWRVSAVDVSAVAIERAKRAARENGVTVEWIVGSFEDAPLTKGGFDLVSAQYAALRHTPQALAEHKLIDLVAPKGVLLVVHHAHAHHDASGERHFDPSEYVSPTDVAAALGEDWTVSLDNERPRHLEEGAGAHHRFDVVLKATRLH